MHLAVRGRMAMSAHTDWPQVLLSLFLLFFSFFLIIISMLLCIRNFMVSVPVHS